MPKCFVSLLIASISVISLFPPVYAIENKGADITYKVVIDNPADGLLNVIAIFNKLPDTDLAISERDAPEYLNLSGLKAEDEKKNQLAITTTLRNKKKIYSIGSKGLTRVSVEYSVHPGAVGRHGHIGYLDQRFGIICGKNIFLFPLDDQGIKKIAVEFSLPQGWQVVCPWEKEGDIFVIDPERYRYRLNIPELLEESVMAFGSFKSRQRQVNGFNTKIYAFAEWPDERIDSICEQTFRLLKYQLDLFGAEQKWDYTVVYVPEANDRERRVFGGSWSLCLGFEMERPSLRRWELLSHRVHHIFNKYQPLAMQMKERSDKWFSEATASYYEAKALAALGYYKLKDRMSGLKRDYDFQRAEFDTPLSTDYKKRGETVEYLHYKKAPLVAYLIDRKIKKDTQGRRDLDRFIRYLYSIYGTEKRVISLKEELNQFTGTDFSDFFAKYVDGTELIEFSSGHKNAITLVILFFISAGIWLYYRSRRKVK